MDQRPDRNSSQTWVSPFGPHPYPVPGKQLWGNPVSVEIVAPSSYTACRWVPLCLSRPPDLSRVPSLGAFTSTLVGAGTKRCSPDLWSSVTAWIKRLVLLTKRFRTNKGFPACIVPAIFSLTASVSSVEPNFYRGSLNWHHLSLGWSLATFSTSSDYFLCTDVSDHRDACFLISREDMWQKGHISDEQRVRQSIAHAFSSAHSLYASQFLTPLTHFSYFFKIWQYSLLRRFHSMWTKCLCAYVLSTVNL